jgi:hypothetical protein
VRDRRARKALWKEIRRIAEADLALVAEEIRALESEAEGDAYYRAVGLHARAESHLATAATLADLRDVARLAADARHQIACARAGEELTPRPLCLFDPAHGPSAREVVFARTGGALESVPACSACAEEVDAGRAPLSRKVIVAGRPQPYYRSPAHVGYYGSGDETLSDLLVVDLGSAALTVAGLGLLDIVVGLDLGV